MATQDTTNGVENEEDKDLVVDTTKVEDESNLENNQEDAISTGDEDNGEDTADGNKTEVESKAEFKKRFTQLKGETAEEYLKNLEEAYAQSSTEGQKNAREVKKFEKIAQLVATDPDFAAKFNAAIDGEAPAVAVDPAIAWAKQQMEESYQKDYKEFSDLHPEIITDTELYNELVDELDVIGAAYEKRGKKLTMAEGLRKAWISLGKDADDKKAKVVDAVKNQASSASSKGGAKKPDGKQEFSAEQLAVAEKMGLTPKQLAEYNK